MLKPEVLDAMLAAGCTAEQIVAAVKADVAGEDERASRRRELDAERKRRQRGVRSVTRNPADTAESVDGADKGSPDKERSPTPPKEINPSQEKTPKGVQKKGSPTGTRLPEDWCPSEADLDFARREGLDQGTIDREAAKFADYWHAKAGQGARKLDWHKTWCNWCRNAPKRAPPSISRNREPSAFDQFSQYVNSLDNDDGQADTEAYSPPDRSLRLISGYSQP